MIAGLASLAPLVASAAPAPPAAPLPLVPRSALGGCIYAAVAEPVRKAAVEDIANGRPTSAPLAAEIARVGPHCAARPLSPDNRALNGAAMAAFYRSGLATRLRADLGLDQKVVDDTWRAAAPDDQAPYLTAARDFLDAKSVGEKVDVAAVTPFRARLKLSAGARAAGIAALNSYFYYTALGEMSETQLSSEKPKTDR